ncbi:hypothetical protein DTO021D3_4593 [Paecilomyces variotii]|nr:hypothetical protein DTO032I3_4423 [Paecilomyces variotii]KAJ9278395.1 hypothetical protein DTO021D3_4593 [Paecilomyces variotii]KAJ9339741.1 hypothetical protein DTO027B6_7651 [Paecilomyces variotii]KAJ9377878.1 hypothetical protein DTO032I4_7866 [Paecilomyces variotii]
MEWDLPSIRRLAQNQINALGNWSTSGAACSRPGHGRQIDNSSDPIIKFQLEGLNMYHMRFEGFIVNIAF